jgi:hypothetical protein
MLQFLALPLRILAAGGRQHVDARPIKKLFLEAELTFALGKLFVDYFPVERNDVRRELFELLRKHDAAFGEISTRQLFRALGRPLDKVSKPDAEFDYALVIVIVERFRHDAAFVQDGPELVGATGVVMAHAHGRFARIAADDDQLHAFSQMVGECSHLPSVAYFEFGVPSFRAGRSERSSPLASNRTVYFAGGNTRLLQQPTVVHNAMKQEKIEDFLAAGNL